MKQRLRFLSGNRIALVLMMFYLIIVLCAAYLACVFSYQRRKGELLTSLDLTLTRVTAEFDDLSDNFWSVYIPLYEDNSEGATALKRFYLPEDTVLDP